MEARKKIKWPKKFAKEAEKKWKTVKPAMSSENKRKEREKEKK